MSHDFDDPAKLVPLYANLGKLRLFASPNTIESAEFVLKHIVTVYESPNKDFRAKGDDDDHLDILRSFSRICRNELL